MATNYTFKYHGTKYNSYYECEEHYGTLIDNFLLKEQKNNTNRGLHIYPSHEIEAFSKKSII